MRAIDADALLPKLYVIKEAERQIYGKASWDFVNRCIHVVEDAPTIDPERKKGKWKKVYEGNGLRDECDKCGERYPNAYGYNFCPKCGQAIDWEGE